MGLIDSQRRFLNMMGKNYIPLICQSTGIILHIFLCYKFVWVLELEIKGVGYASTITNVIIYFLLFLYSSMLPDINEAVQFPTKQIFCDIS